MKSIYSFTAITFLFCSIASTHPTLGQPVATPLYSDLSKACGFIIGQKLILNRIKEEYPDLNLQVQKAELEFQSAFGTAERNIHNAFKELLAEKYAEFMAQGKRQLESIASSRPLDRQIAANIIAEVESRAKGDIPSPILETLLTYQFREQPTEEVSLGYSRVFRTKDHPKAKGVDFQIRYPVSWLPREGDRPNIIQKFVSENGRGLEIILIMVKDIPLPQGYKITKKDVDDLFTERELKGMVPRGATISTAKPIILDGQKGGMVIFDQTVQRLDITLRTRHLYFVTLHGSKMIFVQCTVSAPPGKEIEVGERFSRFEPLFRWVGNSFVIQEKYR